MTRIDRPTTPADDLADLAQLLLIVTAGLGLFALWFAAACSC